MKINSDLRMAVRSAYNIQKKTRENSWETRRKAERDAVERLLKANPKIRKGIEKAIATINRCNAEAELAAQLIRSYGIERGYRSSGEYGICDQEKFAKAGGKLDFKEPSKWTFDQVMAQLAAADEKETAAILRTFGINWS